LHTIHETVKVDMPKEFDFVQRFDEAKKAIQQIVDMPDKLITLMLTFLHQNKGVLSKRKREEFAKLIPRDGLWFSSSFLS
jgi:hypothetical protein